MTRPEAVPTTPRPCKNCDCTTPQQDMGGWWLCMDCLFNAETELKEDKNVSRKNR